MRMILILLILLLLVLQFGCDYKSMCGGLDQYCNNNGTCDYDNLICKKTETEIHRCRLKSDYK